MPSQPKERRAKIRRTTSGREGGRRLEDHPEWRELLPDFNRAQFNLDPSKIPQETLGLLDLSWVLRLGALPLGVKDVGVLGSSRKILNIGLLNPARVDIIRRVEMLVKSSPAQAQISALKAYRIRADQFLEVLTQVYGVKLEELRRYDRGDLDPVLARLLSLRVPEEQLEVQQISKG